METELREMEEIKQINSTSRTGISIINAEIHDTIANPDDVWSRLRDRLNDVAPTLPAAAAAPEFNDTDTEIDAYTLIVALTWEQAAPVPYAILRRLAEGLEDQLRSVPGTKHTKLVGDPTEEIQVELSLTQLTALGLTSADLSRAITRTLR